VVGSDYFRKQAQTCLALAEISGEGTIATTLKLMAAEFLERAIELDEIQAGALIVLNPANPDVSAGGQ
jgi:hypothetical protein